MPFADGVYGHSTGQAYARSKAGSAQKSEGGDDRPKGAEDTGDKGAQAGSVLHVKHHGGGKFSVKHEDGSVTKHDSPEDMHQHMMQHFGVTDAEQGSSDYDEDSDTEDYEGGDALKSILG
jgi:hypothetical protein